MVKTSSARLAFAGVILFSLIVLPGVNCQDRLSSVVDLVVIDNGSGKALGEQQLLLYFDVLSGGRFQEPDVVLTESALEFDGLGKALLEGDHLYVLNVVSHANSIYIFSDYRSLVDDALPSVVLEIPGESVVGMEIANNRLYVSNNVFDQMIHVWDDIDQMVAPRPPDLTISDLTFGGFVVDGDLLAINRGFKQVALYEVFENESKTLGAREFAVLNEDSIPINGLENVGASTIIDNTLYVATGTEFLAVFEHADALSTGDQSDALVSSSGTFSGLSYMQTNGRYLFTGGDSIKYAITVFDGREPLAEDTESLGGLPLGTSGIRGIRQMRVAGDALFVLGGNTPVIHVFSDGGKILRGQQEADFIIPPGLDLFEPIMIDAQIAPGE
jgi:hypothetical protein